MLRLYGLPMYWKQNTNISVQIIRKYLKKQVCVVFNTLTFYLRIQLCSLTTAGDKNIQHLTCDLSACLCQHLAQCYLMTTHAHMTSSQRILLAFQLVSASVV